MAFRIRKGLFKYRVIPFGLRNTPATVQDMMDTIFNEEAGCDWSIDNIRIYGGNTEPEHQAFVNKDLQQCVKNGLAVNPTKSEFHMHETILLEDIINGSQVTMNPAKFERRGK